MDKSRFSSWVRGFRINYVAVLRSILAVLAVLWIVYLLPKDLRFRFEFEKGKAWMYNDLISPFDFPIQRTSDELENDKKQVLEELHPYFRTKLGASRKAIQKLNAFLSEKKIKQVRKFAALDSALLRVYARGIIQPFPEGDFKNSSQLLLIKENKEEMSASVSDFLSLQQAYDICERAGASVDKSDQKWLPVLLDSLLDYSILYDSTLTRKMSEDLVSNVLETDGMMQKGELLITRGSIINAEKFRALQSLKKEFETSTMSFSQRALMVTGQGVIVSLIIGLYLTFLYNFRKEVFLDNRRLLLLLLNISLTVMVFSIWTEDKIESVYFIPLCILPIVTRVFFDSVIAVFTHLLTVLLLSFFARDATEFIIIQSLAGLASVFSLINIRRRSRFYVTSGIVFLAYALAFSGFYLLHSGDLRQMDPMYYGWFAVNALLLLLASPLMYGYEKIFNLVSEVTLLELSDSNNPLLKDLSFKAPGTFQHSLQVANLAEAAISEIGGNALLVRVGALYHDIGKSKNPRFFIENQAGGINPHDELAFEESAAIIIGHVREGLRMAREAKLPEVILDFIRTHHGNQRVEYFYRNFLRNFPHRKDEEEKFRYPGPRPFSKETAVLMMADSVEAAARSLKEVNEEKIAQLVDSILDKQLQNQQFDNANITLRDIAKVKRIFKKMLNSIYHVRIEYPREIA